MDPASGMQIPFMKSHRVCRCDGMQTKKIVSCIEIDIFLPESAVLAQISVEMNKVMQRF